MPATLLPRAPRMNTPAFPNAYPQYPVTRRRFKLLQPPVEFVIGEIALGGLRNPAPVLKELQRLPVASVATDQEVLRFIRDSALGGRGIGYVDAHLPAAVRLSAGTTLWTRDKRLLNIARELSLAAP